MGSERKTTAFSVAVIGGGRLGTALAEALRHSRCPVTGPYGRGQRPEGADAVLLCVPDSEIGDAASAVAGSARYVGHTSGATPLTALAPSGGEAFGLHPLQTFPPGAAPDSFAGAGCAVAGETGSATAFATALAETLGMRPFELAEADRAAYHAAASVASNFLVTLQGAAEELAGHAGLEPGEARALLAPLVRSTVENWAHLGPERALTGPVARGDEATVAAQRAAVADRAPALLPLFDSLCERTRDLAGRGVPA